MLHQEYKFDKNSLLQIRIFVTQLEVKPAWHNVFFCLPVSNWLVVAGCAIIMLSSLKITNNCAHYRVRFCGTWKACMRAQNNDITGFSVLLVGFSKSRTVKLPDNTFALFKQQALGFASLINCATDLHCTMSRCIYYRPRVSYWRYYQTAIKRYFTLIRWCGFTPVTDSLFRSGSVIRHRRCCTGNLLFDVLTSCCIICFPRCTINQFTTPVSAAGRWCCTAQTPSPIPIRHRFDH